MKKTLIILALVPGAILVGLGAATAAVEASRIIYWRQR